MHLLCVLLSDEVATGIFFVAKDVVVTWDRRWVRLQGYCNQPLLFAPLGLTSFLHGLPGVLLVVLAWAGRIAFVPSELVAIEPFDA